MKNRTHRTLPLLAVAILTLVMMNCTASARDSHPHQNSHKRSPQRHHSFGSKLRQKLIKPLERGGRQLVREAVIKPAERQAREYVKNQFLSPAQQRFTSSAQSAGLHPRHSRPAQNPKPAPKRH